MNELQEGLNYSEMRAELQALRQKLEDLETRQAACGIGGHPTARRKFPRRLITASISLAALLMVAGGLLWGQQIQALFVNNKGDVGIGTNDPKAKLDVAGKLKAAETEVLGLLKAGTLEVANPAGTKGWLKVGITTDPNVQLDVAAEPRTRPTKYKGAPNEREEPRPVALYVTGQFDPARGVEFRDSNQTQGIGFGYNTIYATGESEEQNLSLMPRPKGRVMISGNNGLDVDGEISGKKGLDVKGEIRGKPWISRQYSRKANEPAKKMTRMDRSVCFLTSVNGIGSGETVWIGNDEKPRADGFSYWLLEGKSGGWNAAASARCIGAQSPGDGQP